MPCRSTASTAHRDGPRGPLTASVRHGWDSSHYYYCRMGWKFFVTAAPPASVQGCQRSGLLYPRLPTTAHGLGLSRRRKRLSPPSARASPLPLAPRRARPSGYEHTTSLAGMLDMPAYSVHVLDVGSGARCHRDQEREVLAKE